MNLLTTRLSCAIAVLSLMLGGCVTHIPISESAMFHDAMTRPSHEKTFGFGLVGTYAPARSIAVDLAKQQYPGRNHADLLINPDRFSGGLYLASFDSTGLYGISATAGPFVMGIDATLKLFGRNYFTAAASVPGQWQVFAQHRTFNSPKIAAAIGLGYQRDIFTFDVSSECICLSFDDIAVESVGVRGFTILRDDRDKNGGIKIGAYVGYIPRLERPLLTITLTAGRF